MQIRDLTQMNYTWARTESDQLAAHNTRYGLHHLSWTKAYDVKHTGRGKQGRRTVLYSIAMSQDKCPELRYFFMSITKMTVLTMRLQRKKAPAALPVFSSAGLPQHPSLDSLNTSQLWHELAEQDGRPEDC